MKRILLSILISLGLIIVYLVISSIIVVLTDYDLSVVQKMGYPLALPKTVYYYFSPPITEDYTRELTSRKAITGTLAFLVNILIYAIPVYIGLSLIAKFRKPKQLQENEPPPPPSF